MVTTTLAPREVKTEVKMRVTSTIMAVVMQEVFPVAKKVVMEEVEKVG